MLRRTKKHQKKLAKLVLAALLFTGGGHGLMSPSVAEAADPVTVTGYASGNFVPDSSSMRSYYYDYYYYYAPADGTVTDLNLAQGTAQGAWSDPGRVAGRYGSGTSGASGVTVNMTGTDVVVSNLYGGFAVGTGSSSTDLGTASDNTVNISAGKVSTRVAGGYSITTAAAAQYYSYYGGNADGNTVTISGDAEVGKVAGGSSYYGGANNNKVFIKEKAVTKSVSGGEAEYFYGVNTDVSGNTVTISGNAVVNGTVYGGNSNAEPYYSETLDTSANANGNTVTISDKAAVSGSVYGGYTYGYYAKEANANGNTVTISGDAAVGGGVTGGLTYSMYYYDSDSGSYVGGSANNNTVTISGNNTVGDSVYGGKSGYGSADSNKVIISGETVISGKGEYDYGYYVTAKIYGGSSSSGNADGNKVAVSENVSVGVDTNRVYIYGGSSSSGNADRNEVTISDAAAIGEKSADYGYVYLYGGYTQKNGSADGNKVTISNDAVIGSNSSKGVYVNIYGGYAYYGSTSNNTVTIGDDAVVGGNNYAVIYGAYGYGTANENTVTISGNAVVGEKAASVYGAYGYGASTGNTVTISGKASVGSEGSAHIYGSYTSSGAEGDVVNNNTVTISGEAVVGYGYVTGASSSNGTVSNNTVTISEKAVVGGASEERIYGGSSSSGTVSNNTVTIRDEAAVSSESQIYIYGGYTGYGASADNNTVTIRDKAAVTGASRLDISGGYSSYGSAGSNSVVFSDDTAVTVSKNAESSAETQIRISGGYSYSGSSADNNEIAASGNAVVGSGADRLYIFGGFAQNATATAKENKVTFSGKASVGSDASYVSIYGGGGTIVDTYYYYYYSYTFSAAAADNNTVTISGSAAVGANASYVSIYGGQSYSNSSNENTVTISDNAVVGSSYAVVYGGYAGGNGSAGTEASVNADKNTVTISNNAVVGGDYDANVIGGNSSKGSANDNTVTISDNAVVGGGYGASIYGGESYSSSANNNTVTISDSAVVGSEYAYIMGAYGSSTANDNTVTISGNAAVAAGSETHASSVSILGAYAYAYGIEEGGASNNAVTIRDDATVGSYAYSVSIYGAQSYYGIVSNNTVTISNNAVVATHSGTDSYYSMQIMGGQSYYGIAENNTVTISGGTVGDADNYKNGRITGGSSYVEATGNTVTIEGDTTTVYAGAVVGGYSQYTENTSANTTDNTVTINAKEVAVGLVYGGRTDKGNASKNKVTITNGSVTGKVSSPGYYYGIAAVAGGYVVKNGDATSNTVELNGVTVSVPENDGSGGSPVSLLSSSAASPVSITLAVVGGYSGTGNAMGNTVKLQDTIISGGVYGGAGDSPSDTGDSSTRDLVTGNTLVLGGINTVNGEVTNFETIKLTDTVAWSSGTTVLKAGQFTDNANGTRASLDVTDAETNLATATSGQMKLLASDTENDFKTLSLIYSGSDSPVSLSETNLSKILKTGEQTPESQPTNGVTLTSASTQIVSLDADNSFKNVLYKVESIPSKISLGEMTWGTGRDLDGLAFGENATIDASQLSFGGTDNTPLKANDSMTLVSGAAGISAIPAANITQPGEGKGTVAVEFTDSNNITFNATASGTVGTDGSDVKYTVSSVATDKVTLGSLTWGTTAEMPDSSWTASAATQIDATNFAYTGTATTRTPWKKDTPVATILNIPGLTAESPVTTAVGKTVGVTYTNDAGVSFTATAKGHVGSTADAVNYVVDEVTLTEVDLSGWTNIETAVPDTWTADDGTVSVATGAKGIFDNLDVAPNSSLPILTMANTFGALSGDNVYGSNDFSDTKNGITVAGKQDRGVQLANGNKSLVYAAGTKNANSIDIGAVTWQQEAFDATTGYDFTNVSEIGTDKFDVTYAKPEDVAINDSMTLLKANETLTAIVDELKTSSYKNYEIAPGVLMDGSITGTMNRSGNDVVFTATANQADKLTFTDVEWKDSGALMTRPANVMFAGADVDTAKINFHNIQELAANSRMTLVSDFGETVGTITGDTFTVGSGLQGEGAASLSGTDLVFTAKTGAESLTPTEATHETVMAMEAGTAVVAAGCEYVDSAVEGLGLVSNMAPDGTSTFASMGGGVGRYKTGSHVDTHTWSAVVAVGSKRDHKKGNLEWGVFAEYGRGNYTLHDDNGGRGDGNTHYAGGGLLAKWTNKHDVYTEASFRMGRMSDSASNMLRDVLGNTYGYDVHANYFGGHVGFGKIYKVQKTKDLDVYGKFFYTRRNGVDFDAGGNHYSLDSVASKLLRIGARYGSNDRKWNWYGGLAYEYEFGGESKGSVDGLAIRSASIKGASVRGEIGVRLEATKTNPWKADISIYGYGGKHRGIGGTVSVAYMF